MSAHRHLRRRMLCRVLLLLPSWCANCTDALTSGGELMVCPSRPEQTPQDLSATRRHRNRGSWLFLPRKAESLTGIADTVWGSCSMATRACLRQCASLQDAAHTTANQGASAALRAKLQALSAGFQGTAQVQNPANIIQPSGGPSGQFAGRSAPKSVDRPPLRRTKWPLPARASALRLKQVSWRQSAPGPAVLDRGEGAGPECTSLYASEAAS